MKETLQLTVEAIVEALGEKDFTIGTPQFDSFGICDIEVLRPGDTKSTDWVLLTIGPIN